MKLEYPEIVRDLYYYQISSGWFPLVEDFLLELKKLDLKDFPKLTEVKQKFGLLRIHLDEVTIPDWEKVSSLVNKFEELSSQVCEVCGSISRVNQISIGGYIQSKCASCYTGKLKR
jgi:hypothetical protein